MSSYVPSRGNFVVLSLDSRTGQEQKGRRPALLVSVDPFNRATGLAYCCPVTNTERGSAFHVPLPDLPQLTSFVICEQMKSIDYRARAAKRIGTAPRAFFDEVLGVIDACIYTEPGH